MLRRVLAVVPVKRLEAAKARLAPVLPAEARAALVLRMLDTVLAACAAASSVRDVLVVSPDPALGRGADVLVDDGEGQGAAVALALRDPRARAGALVVMADCPLASAASLDALAAAADPLALVRSRDGGTNALAVTDPLVVEPVFGTAGSAAATVRRARAAGLEPAVLADPALAFDVDRPSDLAQVGGLLVAERA
jgi:2-phospho-L-lactate guanylyltransferase